MSPTLGTHHIADPGEHRALTYLILAKSDSPQLRYRHLTIFNILRRNRPINEHTKKVAITHGADKPLRCIVISVNLEILFSVAVTKIL